jgi:hypothetical protein
MWIFLGRWGRLGGIYSISKERHENLPRSFLKKAETGSKWMNIHCRLCGYEFSARSRRQWFVHLCKEWRRRIRRNS